MQPMFTESIEENQSPTLYQMIGGDIKLRELVDRFYDLMDLEPQFATIRQLHPATLDSSRDKLYWFLSGWTGGPNLFIEKFGHPRLRMRHIPFSIGINERDQWVKCMDMAMIDVKIVPTLRQHLLQSFMQTADFMRNKAE